MSGNTRKNQVTRLVTLRHQSTMSGALGIELTTFLEQPVLLIRPANEVLRFYQQLSCESLVRE